VALHRGKHAAATSRVSPHSLPASETGTPARAVTVLTPPDAWLLTAARYNSP